MLCDNCLHKYVCKYADTYKKAAAAMVNAYFYESEDARTATDISSIDWLEVVPPNCRFCEPILEDTLPEVIIR